MENFQEYLKSAIENDMQEFRMVVRLQPDSIMKFYIHPMNKNGRSGDFIVDKNLIVKDTEMLAAVPNDILNEFPGKL